MDKVLLISHKLNDIFYFLSALKQDSIDTDLVIFHRKKMDYRHFQLNSYFNNIYEFELINSKWDIFKLLCRLYFFMMRKRYTKVYLSNPFLLVNQLIVKLSKTTNVLLLEDGLMNYYNFKSMPSGFKKLVQKLMVFSDGDIFNLISNTYLLKPDDAVLYFGQKKQIYLSKIFNLDCFKFLDSANVFVGQPYYDLVSISIEEYNTIVNSLIRDNFIDWYIPHPFSSPNEVIDCKIFDPNIHGVSIEMLSLYYTFNVFSISSSVLYSVKAINRNSTITRVLSTRLESTIGEYKIIDDSIDKYIYND